MNAHLEKLLPVATSELRAQFLRSREQSGWVALAAAGYDPFFLPGEEYYGRATVAVTKVLCLLGQADHPRAATAFFRGIASREDRRIAAPAYEAYARRAGLYRLQTGHGLLRPLTRHPGDMPKNVLDGRSANPHVLREVDPWSYVVHALPKLIMGPQAQAGERVPVEYVEKLDPEDLTALMRTGNVSAIRGYYEALAGLPNGVPYRHHQSMVEMALFLSAQSSQSEQTDGHTTLNNSEDVTAAMEMQSLRQEAESMHTGLVNEQGLEAELLITCHAIGEMPFSSLRIAYALEAAAIRQRYQVHTPQSNEAFDRLLYQIWSVASATLPARGDTRLSELWQQLVAVGFTSETFYRIEEADHPNED